MDAKLDGHDKTLAQLSRALTDLSAKVAADAKLTSEHLAEVNKSVSSVAKALRTVGEAIETREAEQDRRLDEMAKTLHGAGQTGAVMKEGKAAKDGKRTPRPGGSEEVAPAKGSGHATGGPALTPAVAAAEGEPADNEEKSYEQSLQAFKAGDYEGARKQFKDFLHRHPDSKLAGNAQYWLGECYYGTKDYGQAIEAFDRLHRSYPGSTKEPAALLKKGFAYVALNDRGRASSALKQVVETYPKSPEAMKAKEKSAQLSSH